MLDGQDVAEREELDEMQRTSFGETSDEENRGRTGCYGFSSWDAL